MAPRHHKGEWILALYKWQGRLCQDMSPAKPPQKIRKDCGREQGKDVRPWKRNHTIHQGCKKGDIVGIHLESLKKTRSKARLKEQGEDVTLKKKKKRKKKGEDKVSGDFGEGRISEAGTEESLDAASETEKMY